MYLSRIYIQDFRILKDIELRFQPPVGKSAQHNGNVVNVVAGVNGCGKTTLLDAIFMAICDPHPFIKNENSYFEVDGASRFDKQNYHTWYEQTHKLNSENQNNTDYHDVPRILYLPSQQNFSYSAVAKLKLSYVFAQKIDTSQILGNAEFFIKEYVLAHERESSLSDPKARTKEAVDKFNAHFCDAQLLTKLVDLSKADFNTPVFSNATGDLVNINALSDGEKQLYARVIALMMLEPRNSIILIDEPEIALHPAWQQKIMQIYASIGENNQFIVVTHSPQVIRSVPYQNRIILHKNNDERKIAAVYMDSPPTGIDINSILSEIMGAEKIPADLLSLYRQYRSYVENKQEQTPEAEAIKQQILAQESEQSEFMQEMGFLIDLRAIS